jgi:Lon protease-like protein
VFTDAFFPSTIPIFPLPLVLFPGQVKQLRIFEPRYRQMLHACLNEDAPFGIVLEKNGATGEPESSLCPIGTLAHITRVEQLPDGTYGIQFYGGERFRIHDFKRDEPYLQARIESHPLLGAQDGETDRLHQQVRQLLTAYLDALTQASGFRFNVQTIPALPKQLAYLTAATLQTNNERKQTLLVSSHLPQLFDREISLLISELDLMAWITETIATTHDQGFGSDNRQSLN